MEETEEEEDTDSTYSGPANSGYCCSEHLPCAPIPAEISDPAEQCVGEGLGIYYGSLDECIDGCPYLVEGSLWPPGPEDVIAEDSG